MTITFFPIWIVDMVGAVLMIVFALLCLRFVKQLKRRDEDNVIWTYLLWVCYGLTAFAISRSAGHILKQIFFLFGNRNVWETLRPFTGAVNTFMLVFVASVTLFFERVWRLYQQILKDKLALQKTHQKLLYLNQNLEDLVKERTTALVSSERKYRSIFEGSLDTILVSDTHGYIMELNPVGYRLLGLQQPFNRLKDRNVADCFAKPTDWQKLCFAIDRDGFFPSTEVDLVRGDGRKIRVMISATLNRGPTDAEDALHFMIKDVEKQRLMREQIAQADKLASIGELSAGIAHEINNPIGIILGYTQLLLRSENAASERYGDLKTIEKHVRNCKSIVENLLSFARNTPPKKEEVNINETINDVLHFVQHNLELDSILIVTQYDHSMPSIFLDEPKVRQVLMNLIMNARHAVGKTGTITLSTHYEAQIKHALITVEDTGYGIEKKNLGRIFDPFFTTKPTGEGTGLGLSVSYGIIKNHGGDIFVESTPGQGAKFIIDLPATSAPVGG